MLGAEYATSSLPNCGLLAHILTEPEPVVNLVDTSTSSIPLKTGLGRVSHQNVAQPKYGGPLRNQMPVSWVAERPFCPTIFGTEWVVFSGAPKNTTTP